MIDHTTLLAIMPSSGKFVFRYVDFLDDAMNECEINTPVRQAMFLAQLAEESGELRYARELWGPTPAQLRYERDFSAPWVKGDPVNGKAFGLGNSEPGDGIRFMGRGLIQITGRYNYSRYSELLFNDPQLLLVKPEMLEQTMSAARSAALFWKDRGCNDIADRDDFVALTKRINGGLTHYDRRVSYLERAKRVLGV